MGRLIAKTAGELAYHVRKFTVGEIYEFFNKAVDAQATEPDWVGNVLFEEVTIQDILTFSDLTTEQIHAMEPEVLETIITAIKEENPHFFAACQRLEEAGKRLNQVLTTASEESDSSSGPSSPSSNSDTPV
ncbi:hypothetical protein Mmc1_2885 [Magnetococcus marinus MC-1]|uniref:Uncharacterized protein n=1 Tax=Magnetococcus marinus (strain ATCC BAA-1437 / JCM 17883 / MC-1) TaxID=156889 RepID=A0LBN3_MAGMM|nr:hypothetical protein [Magnetococcus marinus]ABK45376.1 hypothetical protein Mmc1_2885 [Magnetococcus marinus MC-1]